MPVQSSSLTPVLSSRNFGREESLSAMIATIGSQRDDRIATLSCRSLGGIVFTRQATGCLREFATGEMSPIWVARSGTFHVTRTSLRHIPDRVAAIAAEAVDPLHGGPCAEKLVEYVSRQARIRGARQTIWSTWFAQRHWAPWS